MGIYLGLGFIGFDLGLVWVFVDGLVVLFSVVKCIHKDISVTSSRPEKISISQEKNPHQSDILTLALTSDAIFHLQPIPLV